MPSIQILRLPSSQLTRITDRASLEDTIAHRWTCQSKHYNWLDLIDWAGVLTSNLSLLIHYMLYVQQVWRKEKVTHDGQQHAKKTRFNPKALQEFNIEGTARIDLSACQGPGKKEDEMHSAGTVKRGTSLKMRCAYL